MKKILTLAGMLAMSAVLSASPLTPEQALKRAQANSPRLKKAATAAPSASLHLSYSLSTPAGEPALYVFDYPASAGYMIVSADDAAAPVLGYADSGSFDSENIPPQMAWWLSQYAAGIEYASEKGIKASATTRSSKAAVAPLMKTKWNQGTPYNDLCPSVNSVRCPSGCVATAMAQVMKYHNYPDVGTGRVVATLPQGQGVTGDPYINLASKPFDWDNMLDEYSGYSYTTAQATAVATLMQAAGYASKMSYGVKGSGALSLNAAMALSKNFKYNPNIQYLQRNYFNASDWGEIIYKELAAGRPVMYGGQSTSVGHEFVCDGYDGNGYYHFNWGWGGMSDGYFLLDALNPESVGTGGGEGGGYNSGQDIIIGIQPSSVETDVYLTQFGNLSASASGSNISLALNYNGNVGNWVNAGISAVKVRMGAEIVSVDNSEIKPQYVRLFSNDIDIPALTLNGYNISYQGIKGNATVSIPSILPNGKYKVTVCTQDATKTDAPWTPVCTTNGAYNFVYVTKNGSSCSVENFKETELSIVSAEPTTQVYYENACRFRLSVKNNSNLELSGGFYPVLYDGNTPAFLGEGITMSLAPGESDNVEFVTTFELLNGVSAPTETKEYTLRFSKNSNGSAFYNWSMPLSMGLLLRAPTFNTSNYCIEGAPTREETINGQTRTAYVVPDPSEIPFAATITNTGTFFGSPVYTLIYNSTLSGYNLTSLAMGPTAILNRGESATVKGSVDFSEAEDGEAYAAAIFYINGGKLTQHTGSQILYFIVDSTASAVNEIEYDNAASDNEIYNLQGIPVGKDLNSLPAGIYIRNGKKILKKH